MTSVSRARPFPKPEAEMTTDRRLLRQSQEHWRHQERSHLTRVSLPPKPTTPLMPHSNRRALQGRLKSLKRSPVLIMYIDDLHDHPIRLSSSSSPNMPITSPTVSALQNRQRTRVPLPPENTTTNLTP